MKIRGLAGVFAFAGVALASGCGVSAVVGGGDDYDPCGGKACGEECTVCSPNDPDCVETAVIKVCNADGVCGAGNPDDGCGAGGYDACADKACGDMCTICDPNDPDCVETDEVKVCDQSGTCVADSGNLECGGGYDPCGGKTCGDMCTLCDPNDPDCFETAEVKVCNGDNQCVSDDGAIECGGGEYEPCGGKACGDSCTLCDPDDPDCSETAVEKICDDVGQCVTDTNVNICYAPCEGKMCGDGCTLCPPGDEDCVETAVEKFCQSDSVCAAQVPACG